MKILFTGGGTLGSVTPLIAVSQKMQQQGIRDFIWVGTKTGPEEKIVKENKIKFYSVNSGKLRRYFSWQNFVDVLYIIIGFFQAFGIIIKEKPRVVMTAGSFVAVPVCWAAWLLGKKIITIQLDLTPGLANKLTAIISQKIAVALPEEKKFFDRSKTTVTGIAVRQEICTLAQRIKNDEYRQKLVRKLNLNLKKPILLVIGGGTGAAPLNELIWNDLANLLEKFQIVHITGKGKNKKLDLKIDYYQFEFLASELFDYLAVADLVISRAGMGFLAELSILAKATIAIPIPNSHQEINASYFADKSACIYLKQNELTATKLNGILSELIKDKDRLKKLSKNISQIFSAQAAQNIIDLIEK